MAKQLSFSELDNMLSKIDDRGSIITNNAFSKIDEWIHSGNYLLNAQLSGSLFGGYPNSRSVALAGETGTGKTFLAMNACREAQKVGYNIIYCDSEAAVDLESTIKFGINPDYFRYQPINTPKEFRFFVANLIDTIKKAKAANGEVPKVMIVLDSLGNLSTEKSRRDALSGSDKKDMTKQQELKSLFANVTMDLAEHKIPFILTAHTYESVGSFIPQKVMGGGCLTADAKLKTSNGLKNINEIKIGDYVRTTQGLKKVLETFKFKKPVFELLFNDGKKYSCTAEHRFLTGDNPLNNNCYTTTENLNPNDQISNADGTKTILVSIAYCNKIENVYDINVENSHYILENGIVSHNSGALYNTSVINFLYKAKLDENAESKKVGMRKSGIVVRSAPSKNRFARPITIRFHISFYHGMNPYVGLEQFMSWENCGIAKGNIFTQKEFEK